MISTSDGLTAYRKVPETNEPSVSVTFPTMKTIFSRSITRHGAVSCLTALPKLNQVI